MARTCPECGSTYQDNILFCGEDGTPTVPEQPLEGRDSTGEPGSPTRSCPECRRKYPGTIFFCGHDGTITVEDQDPSVFDPRLGKQLGGYLVVARVADGATGRVYEGRHPESKSRVAIKVLHQSVTRDQVAVERFRREYESAHELDHPNVIKVLEYGETGDGSYFMTMEYLVGEELGKVVRRDGSLSRERMVRVVCQAALALQYAHSFGFIHRDLKPDNLFLCRSAGGDILRILDFGSVKLQMETGAKLTALGTTLGSPYYMSPEQARGALDLDQRTDVFALSAIIYEMITGKVAFNAPNVAQILVKIMNETPAPASTINPGSPQSVDDVIEKGLRKKKEGRYETTVHLAEALITAYGLSGSAEQWANTSQSEIAATLQEAVPMDPRPFGAASLPPGGAGAEMALAGGSPPAAIVSESPSAATESVPVLKRASGLMKNKAAMAAVALVAIVLVAAVCLLI